MFVNVILALHTLILLVISLLLYRLVNTKNASVVDVEEYVESAEVRLSDFDKRIMKFREELNTPTYADTAKQTLHPGVVNLPHDSVRDVPIKHEEEYAQ